MRIHGAIFVQNLTLEICSCNPANPRIDCEYLPTLVQQKDRAEKHLESCLYVQDANYLHSKPGLRHGWEKSMNPLLPASCSIAGNLNKNILTLRCHRKELSEFLKQNIFLFINLRQYMKIVILMYLDNLKAYPIYRFRFVHIRLSTFQKQAFQRFPYIPGNVTVTKNKIKYYFCA